MPFWDRELDTVILTHPDSDHLTGLIDVINRYKVMSYYGNGASSDTRIYDHLTSKLADKKLSAKKMSRGDNLKDPSGFSLKIISPRLNSSSEVGQNRANYDSNSLSLVAILRFGNFSALLTADAEAEVISTITEDIKGVSVVKVPHHGSKGGLNDLILTSSDPDIAIISAGENNRYGHPAKDTMEILKKYKIKVLRTDTQGEIDIVSDGRRYSVDTK